jgi:hypothetical protein
MTFSRIAKSIPLDIGINKDQMRKPSAYAGEVDNIKSTGTGSKESTKTMVPAFVLLLSPKIPFRSVSGW